MVKTLRKCLDNAVRQYKHARKTGYLSVIVQDKLRQVEALAIALRRAREAKL